MLSAVHLSKKISVETETFPARWLPDNSLSASCVDRMGFACNRFQKSVDPNLICAICSGVLESPVLTPCGHSFCAVCVHTWLARNDARTCPQCRAWVEGVSVKPILSLRNLIEAMEVSCENAARGCKVIMSIDKQQLHIKSCNFAPVTCAGCAKEVTVYDLAAHQMDCAAIKKELEADDDITVDSKTGDNGANGNKQIPMQSVCTWQPRNGSSSTLTPRANSQINSSLQVTRLLSRIRSLEKQVGRLLEDLQESYNQNSLMYLQYRKVKDDLDQQQRLDELRTLTLADSFGIFDFQPFEVSIPNQQDIARLSLLLARFLLSKPSHIDCERTFRAIGRCYKTHFPGTLEERKIHDVHMLLATAYASNWFSSAQRSVLSCWLQCVLRCQGCRRLVED